MIGTCFYYIFGWPRSVIDWNELIWKIKRDLFMALPFLFFRGMSFFFLKWFLKVGNLVWEYKAKVPRIPLLSCQFVAMTFRFSNNSCTEMSSTMVSVCWSTLHLTSPTFWYCCPSWFNSHFHYLLRISFQDLWIVYITVFSCSRSFQISSATKTKNECLMCDACIPCVIKR